MTSSRRLTDAVTCREDSRLMTGQTLGVDAGVWMNG
jgi:hypothetical protein